MQDNQPTAQIAARHNIFQQMTPQMSWIFSALVGIDPGVSRLVGEIVSHTATTPRIRDAKMKAYVVELVRIAVC